MIPEPTAEDLARDAEVFYALHEVLVKHGVSTYANANADAMQWIRRTVAAERERDELRAEVERLKAAVKWHVDHANIRPFGDAK